jgi:hypothetical protein
VLGVSASSPVWDAMATDSGPQVHENVRSQLSGKYGPKRWEPAHRLYFCRRAPKPMVGRIDHEATEIAPRFVVRPPAGRETLR